jgi:hypothetical protein
MRAMVFESYGEPEVMRLRDVPVPEPQDSEVLIRVGYAGVNPSDSKARSGQSARAGYNFTSRFHRSRDPGRSVRRWDRFRHAASAWSRARFVRSALSFAARSARKARRVFQFGPRPSLCATASWTMRDSIRSGWAKAMRNPTGPQ